MYRIIFFFISLLIIGLGSCKKMLDINTDPNNPTNLEVSILLPGTQKSLGNSLAIGSGLSQILAVYMHQMTTRENQDQYGVVGNNFYIANAWQIFYSGDGINPGVISNLDEIIKSSERDGNSRYAGIGKVMKAYAYSQWVDAFGDIPFSEAGQLVEGTRYPKFDNDQDIYPQLFEMINEGISDLNSTENVVLPGADDIIYGGSNTLWVKAANTLKLKLYTQLRKVQNVTPEITALLGGPLIASTAESFLIPYGINDATDDRNPGYGDYFATQRSNHVSPWFYEIMKGYNPRIFTGITDPRIPYYIYNQIGPNQASRDGNQTEYRDKSFVSIYFGSVGPDRDRLQQQTISLLGMYPVGGKYDDGSATVATGTSGTGAAPYRLITYADRLYLEAELMHTGVIPGNVREKLDAALKESFKQVDFVVAKVGSSQSVPVLANSAAATSYINSVLAEYDAGDANKKLEIIMTQKWLSSFGSSVDQYTDYRRTGYPILFDPRNPSMAPGGTVQPPLNGDPVNPGAQKSVPVQLSRDYPLSLPWYSQELETNPNAPQQKNPSTFKVFWMP